MDMRKTGTLLTAILSGVCLAAALGCSGKTRYNVPEVMTFTPAQAATGSTVTITGAYFNDIYSVSFGGMPTTAFQVTKNDNITVTVPADAITGAIVVENPAGIGTSLYYQPAPFIVTPVITTIDPITGPAGTIVTITGSGFFDTTAVAVGGETPGAAGSSTFTYHSQNEVVVVVGANATTGPVVLTASGVASAPGPAFTVTPP